MAEAAHARSEPADDAGDAGDAEALRALQDRLERATATAQRLLDEATARRGVPVAGWRADEEPGTTGDGPDAADDLARLFGALAGLLEWVPLELQQRLVTAARELLQALGALIDWCLERLERRRTAPVEVQDIPIL